MDKEKRERGYLEVDIDECKGCGLCIEACPQHRIRLSERLNHYGYRTAEYLGKGCTACGICAMACPEPGAITVLRMVRPSSEGVQPAGDRVDGQLANHSEGGIVMETCPLRR
jgi:NAD-dependent dihydropyrimidine dehydrogenase PreA subunit